MLIVGILCRWVVSFALLLMLFACWFVWIVLLFDVICCWAVSFVSFLDVIYSLICIICITFDMYFHIFIFLIRISMYLLYFWYVFSCISTEMGYQSTKIHQVPIQMNKNKTEYISNRSKHKLPTDFHQTSIKLYQKVIQMMQINK